MKLKYFIPIILCVLSLSCKKYEDGPLFSLIPAKSRLTSTDWEIKNVFTSDGQDITADYYASHELFTLTFYTDGGYNLTWVGNSQDIYHNGRWRLEEKNTILVMRPGETLIDERYKILRLTSNAFWYKDSTYEFHLVTLGKGYEPQ